MKLLNVNIYKFLCRDVTCNVSRVVLAIKQIFSYFESAKLPLIKFLISGKPVLNAVGDVVGQNKL